MAAAKRTPKPAPKPKPKATKRPPKSAPRAPSSLEGALVPLAQISRLPRNPKAHSLADIASSVTRWGFLERCIVNRVTQHLIAGHGRLDTLLQLRESGAPPPANVSATPDDWLVPVDYVSIAESEEEAAAVALNRTVEVGGWDESMLAEVLKSAAQQPAGLDGTGYSDEDLTKLLASLAPPDAPLEFGEYGENISTAYCCPKCGYTWSGRSAPNAPK